MTPVGRLVWLVLLLVSCTPGPSTTDDGVPRSNAERPTPSPSAAVERRCEPPILDAGGPAVVVYLISKNETNPYDLESYAPARRPISQDRARTPIRAALTELFSGVTSPERRGHCGSTFMPEHRDLLLGLDLQDGRVVVNLKDLNRAGLGHVSASHAGSVFLTQILLTLGQFDEVDSVLFRMEGSCEDFYEKMQIGVCMDLDVRRTGSS